MCLIVFAWQRHPEYPLILAGNRDELHQRPAEAMDWWPDAPALLGGRDLQAGGTWFGVTRSGRFAAVTNFREDFRPKKGRRSRGELVTGFLTTSASPKQYCEQLPRQDFAGYSLLAGDAGSIVVSSNRVDVVQMLTPGVYGLSNATLDTPWPKLVRTRDGLARLLERDAVNPNALLTLLADTQPAPASEIDVDGLPFEVSRAMSAPFIRTATYGTRCTTVLLVNRHGTLSVTERRFDEAGQVTGDTSFRFAATRAAVNS